MGQFAKNQVKQHDFTSYKSLVDAFIVELSDTEDIVTIIADGDNVVGIIKEILSRDIFVPIEIHYDNEYCMEYTISALKTDRGVELFINFSWREDKQDYVHEDPNLTEVMFMSMGVDETLYNKFKEERFNIVLFDIH